MTVVTNKKIMVAVVFLFLLTGLFFAPVQLTISPEDVVQIAYAEGDGCNWTCEVGIWFGNILLTLGALVAGIGGVILDKAIQVLVLGMGTLLGPGGSMGAVVNDVWSIVRDVANVMFIFGFIYIGIRTILQPDNSFTKSFLAKLIIAALLINFSLFFTKMVVDITNIAAVEIHDSLINTSEGDIGWAFAERTGLRTIWTGVDAEALAQKTTWGSVTFFIMAFIMLCVAGFVLAAGGVMLVSRFVALIFIMIFSPMLFAAYIFPQTALYASVLLRMLFRYALFAPVFLFLLYLSLRVLETTAGTGLTGGSISKDIIEGGRLTEDGYTVFLQFTIAIAFLYASIKAAQTFAIAGAGGAMRIGNQARGYSQRLLGRAAGGATLGVAARLGRSTLGRIGYQDTQNPNLHRAIVKGGARGLIARAGLRVGERAAAASFDARRIGGMGASLGIGEGKKGGYVQGLKEREKRDKAYKDKFGEDERVYEDMGVGPEYSIYKDRVEKKNEALARYSRETDPEERKNLLREVNDFSSQIKYMEKPPAGSTVPFGLQTVGLTLENIERFSQARTLASNMLKEQFATSVERRGEQLPPVIKQVYNWTINDRTANKYSADSLRKDINKSPTKKLEDAIKGLDMGGSEGE